MADDKFDGLGPMLAQVGEAAMRLVGGEADGIYLYIEAGDNWVGTSLFKDEGEAIRYFDIPDNSGLDALLMDAWHLEPPDKRWTEMHYTIENGKFDARFGFDDIEARDEGSDDRRQRYLDARYGDKPIVYPPMPDDAIDLRPPS